jgi:hypothetical protein
MPQRYLNMIEGSSVRLMRLEFSLQVTVYLGRDSAKWNIRPLIIDTLS